MYSDPEFAPDIGGLCVSSPCSWHSVLILPAPIGNGSQRACCRVDTGEKACSPCSEMASSNRLTRCWSNSDLRPGRESKATEDKSKFYTVAESLQLVASHPWVQHLNIALNSTAQGLQSWAVFQALPYWSPLLSSLRTRQESTGSVPHPHSVTKSPGGLVVELAMTIPQRKPGISWEADSLYHRCLLCSGMPGYHPVSIYDFTMGTKRQAGAWRTLSLVGCPVRLVLGDSRLDSSVVFLKQPCLALL